MSNEKSILQKKLNECKNLWSRYSCDCLYYEIIALEKKLKEIENNE